MSGIAASNVDLTSARKSPPATADAVDRSSSVGDFQQTLTEALHGAGNVTSADRPGSLRAASAGRLAVGKDLPRAVSAEAETTRAARDRHSDTHTARSANARRSAAAKPSRSTEKSPASRSDVKPSGAAPRQTPNDDQVTRSLRSERRAALQVDKREPANAGAVAASSAIEAAFDVAPQAELVTADPVDRDGVTPDVDAGPLTAAALAAPLSDGTAAPTDAGALGSAQAGDLWPVAMTAQQAAAGPEDMPEDADGMSDAASAGAPESAGGLATLATMPTTVALAALLTSATVEVGSASAGAPTSLDPSQLAQVLPASGAARAGGPDPGGAGPAAMVPTDLAALPATATLPGAARSGEPAQARLPGSETASVLTEAARLFDATLKSVQDGSDSVGSASSAVHTGTAEQKPPAVVRSSAMTELFAQLDPDSGPAEITQRVLWMNQQGLQFARIHLHPANLGPIDISLDQRDGGLVVTMTALHPLTRDLLENHAPRMREQLTADGARVDRFDVSDGRSGGAEQRDGQPQRDSRREPGGASEQTERRPIRLLLKGSSLFEAYA